MPRINIEDSLYRDKGYIRLVLAVGCEYKAMGMIVSGWTLAQKHFLSEESGRLIPLNEWPSEDLNLLITVGLAELHEHGVMMKGAEKQFAWLIQRQEAGRKKRKTGDDRALAAVSGRLTEPNGSDPLSLSLSLSHKEKENTSYFQKRNFSEFDQQDLPDESVFGPPPEPPLVEKPPKRKSTKKSKVSEFPIREILQLYPRNSHEHSTPAGMKNLAQSIKTKEDFEACKAAVKKYAEYSSDQDPKFVMSFARWTRDWRELTNLQKPKPFNIVEAIAALPTVEPEETEIDLGAE
jgi:hypothetical protein